ncbi:hypothetical protein RB653_001955 [Dictyostelium firmibasis]|uniref:BTB domain-containing protein n=1 Tax=Dictyostelium firmibasis TaxID=79012 RepID=A0AAN7TWN4_9MYCE
MVRNVVTIDNNENIDNNNENVGESSTPPNIEIDQTPIVNWKIVATSNTPTPRFDNTLVYYNKFIYSYGGSENSINNGGFQQFVKLDLSNFQWQTLAAPPRTRIVHSSVIHGDCMYVFGGGVYEDVKTSFLGATTKVFKTINELWKYEFLLNQWTQILSNQIQQTTIPTQSMINESLINPEPRDGHCAVVVDDNMYIIGGSQTISTTNSIGSVFFTNTKIYNIPTNTWRSVISPEFGRLGSAVVYKHLDGTKCIYFFGGYGKDSNPTNKLYKFDIKSEEWEEVLQKSNNNTQQQEIIIPESRYGHSANVFQDKMLVYGGYSKKKGFLRDFYSFDFDKEEWKQILTEGPPRRRRHSTVLIENYDGTNKPKLYLYGGSYQSCLYNDLWEYSFPNPVQIPSDNLIEDFSTLFRNAKQYFSDICFSLESTEPIVGSNSDETIVITKEIFAHKNILSVRSQYFDSLFKSGLKESFEKVIKINERYEDFKILVEFLYSGNEELVILENCIGILYLSDLYCVPRLKTICEAKATEGIDCETVVQIFKEADSFKLTKLRKLCLNFIARNHKELVKQGSLNQLPPSVLIEIMDYLSSSPTSTVQTTTTNTN